MDLLPIGMPVTLVQNVAYALPAVECVLYTDAATPTLQVSNTPAFTLNTALTLTAGAVAVTGGFIKSTAGAATVTLKRD
jgi:adhesin HecA-like repeat protein